MSVVYIGLSGSQLVQSLAARLHESQITLVVTWRPPLDITNSTGYGLRYRKTSSSTWSSTWTIGSHSRHSTQSLVWRKVPPTKWRFGPLSVMEKVAKEGSLNLQVGIHACTYFQHACE